MRLQSSELCRIGRRIASHRLRNIIQFDIRGGGLVSAGDAILYNKRERNKNEIIIIIINENDAK